jgi:CBS domain containing-hemolysin-like protein
LSFRWLAGKVGAAFLTLIFGELVPKRLAITRSEDIAGLVAWPMGWLSRIAFPAVWLLSHSTRLVLRVLQRRVDELTAVLACLPAHARASAAETLRDVHDLLGQNEAIGRVL